MEMSFGEYLRELRLEKGLSQRELAERVGVTFPYISKIENNNLAAPSEKILEKIASNLEVDPDILIVAAGKIPSYIESFIVKDFETIKFLRNASRKKLSKSEWELLNDLLNKFLNY